MLKIGSLIFLNNTLNMKNIATAKRNVLGAMLLSALLWSACQKTPLPPDVTEPTVFSVTPLDSISTLTAGLNEVYLYTDFGRDSNEVLVFSGTFARVDCQPVEVCPGSVRFEFRNVNEGSNVSPEEAFREGEFEYADRDAAQSATIYRTTFTATNAAEFGVFNWTFDTTDIDTGKVVVRNFPKPVPLKVGLTALAKNQLQSTAVSRTISLSGLEIFPAVQIRIRPDSVNTVTASISGAPVVNYNWSPDSAQKDSQYVDPVLNDQYAVTVTSDAGFTASAQANETFNLETVLLTPNFMYSVQPITAGDPLQLGRVAIQWVDLQGIVWRSDWGKQAQGAQFIVTSTEPYEPNEKGQNTRKMSVVFRCILFNPKLEKREFEGTGVIAVAY